MHTSSRDIKNNEIFLRTLLQQTIKFVRILLLSHCYISMEFFFARVVKRYMEDFPVKTVTFEIPNCKSKSVLWNGQSEKKTLQRRYFIEQSSTVLAMCGSRGRLGSEFRVSR